LRLHFPRETYDDNTDTNDGGNRDEVILKKKYATLYKGDTIVLLTELLVIMKLGYISILLQARLMM
jgi:hypothetical protein